MLSNRLTTLAVATLGLALGPATALAATYTVKSPRGNITLAVSHDPRAGTLTYDVRSAGSPLIQRGSLGIRTSAGDLTAGLAFARQGRREIDETYHLPTGKRSTYVNRARELELAFRRGPTELIVLLRAYD